MKLEFCFDNDGKQYDYMVCWERSSSCMRCNGGSWDCLDCPLDELGAYALFDQQGKKVGGWEYEELFDGRGIEYHLRERIPDEKDLVVVNIPKGLLKA